MKPRRSRRKKYEAHVGDMRNAHKIFVGKTKGKIPLKSPRCKWWDNIKIYLKEKEYEILTRFWVQWRVIVSREVNYWGSIKDGESLD
jgi:hypothetical protein